MGSFDSKPKNVDSFKMSHVFPTRRTLNPIDFQELQHLFVEYEIKVNSQQLSYATNDERKKLMDIFRIEDPLASKSSLDKFMKNVNNMHLVKKDNASDFSKELPMHMLNILKKYCSIHNDLNIRSRLQAANFKQSKISMTSENSSSSSSLLTMCFMCIAEYEDKNKHSFYVAMYFTIQEIETKSMYRTIRQHQAIDCGFLYRNCEPATPAASEDSQSTRPHPSSQANPPQANRPSHLPPQPQKPAANSVVKKKPGPPGPNANNAGPPAPGPQALDKAFADVTIKILADFHSDRSLFLHDIEKHNRNLSAHVVNERVEGTCRYKWRTGSAHDYSKKVLNNALQKTFEDLIDVLYEQAHQRDTELSKMLSRFIMLTCGVNLQDQFVLDCRNLKFTNYTVVHGHDSMYAIFRDEGRTSYTIVYAGNLRPVDGLLQHEELHG